MNNECIICKQLYIMKNTILIVLFNYSNCVNNVEFIKSLYEPHFKKVIFYSDIPEILDNSEVNFVSIRRGFFAHRIFYHFYKKYTHLLDDCDGLFYTMDDNILNVNLLNLMDTTKIIYYYKELKYLNSYSGGHWSRLNGKKAIRDYQNTKHSKNTISIRFLAVLLIVLFATKVFNRGLIYFIRIVRNV